MRNFETEERIGFCIDTLSDVQYESEHFSSDEEVEAFIMKSSDCVTIQRGDYVPQQHCFRKTGHLRQSSQPE